MARATPSVTTAASTERTQAALDLLAWLVEKKGVPPQAAEPRTVQDRELGATPRTALCTTRDVPGGQVVLEMPGDVCITAVDAQKSAVAPLAEGRSELVQLALWLMHERGEGEQSAYRPLVASLPQGTLSPLLWTEAERADLLRGSPILVEAENRLAALRKEWASIEELCAQDPSRFPPERFTFDSFLRSFCVVLAHSTFLPSAECFALVPLLGWAKKTCAAGACGVDYDPERGSVIVVADRMVRAGNEVALSDGRPNAEMLLACGSVETPNPADYLDFEASLVAADRMYQLKKQVVEQEGFKDRQAFPVYEDRMPTQMLAYLRLSRVQDAGQLASVSFSKDTVVSQMNEYEILQLLMGDCRERLAQYKNNAEEDTKMLQDPSLAAKDRLACQMRLVEKRIISGFMDGVRRRLAPIRGIPTKAGGMQDPNADIQEVFDIIESIPEAPKKFMDGFMRWARGEDDPEWNARGKGKGRKG